MSVKSMEDPCRPAVDSNRRIGREPKGRWLGDRRKQRRDRTPIHAGKKPEYGGAGGFEYDAVLQDIVQIDMPRAALPEDCDPSSAIGIGPELGREFLWSNR
jgi:hypothetical protein